MLVEMIDWHDNLPESPPQLSTHISTMLGLMTRRTRKNQSTTHPTAPGLAPWNQIERDLVL